MNGLTRRETLAGLAGLALSGPAWAAPSAKAKAVIMIWLGGGPSQFETWDPKVGRDTGGPTKDIETNVPGLRIAEHLPKSARVMDKISIVRSMTGKEGDHDRGTYYCQTGYVPGPFLHPSLGSMVAKELGDSNADIPNHVALSITPVYGEGFLSSDYAPFRARPGAPIPNVAYSKGLTRDGFRARMDLIRGANAGFRKDFDVPETAGYERADRLIHSPLLKAFDIRSEPERLIKAYGADEPNTQGHFYGQGCLMARRLVEAGVKFVQISVSNAWDHHKDIFTGIRGATRLLDAALSGLVQDLSDRGLLDSTLVLCMGEFGRTPKINKDNGRDHYPKAFSAALAGGGVQGGRVIGATDADGVAVTERPVTVPDLLSTIYTCLGVDPAKKLATPIGARHHLTDHGVPVKELLT